MVWIAFEGIDGSGKTTQLHHMETWLRGLGLDAEVVVPTPLRPVRDVYQALLESPSTFPSAHTSLFLGLADWSHTIEKGVISGQDEARFVLFHRYVYSVYSDATALGISSELLDQLIQIFPEPDLTVLLRTEPSESLKRKSMVSLAEAGGPQFLDEYETLPRAFLAFQQKVLDAYDSLASRHNFLVVPDTGDEATTRDIIKSSVMHEFQELFARGADYPHK